MKMKGMRPVEDTHRFVQYLSLYWLHMSLHNFFIADGVGQDVFCGLRGLQMC